MFTHSSTIRELQQTCSPSPFVLFFWPCASGVLLLNAVLTVRAHQANSHKDRGWEAFTDAVVQWLSKNLEGLVFMLWGSYAQKKGAAIDRVSCFNPGSFSLSFTMCFHTKFSLCVYRNVTTSCRLFIRLPCLLIGGFLGADTSQRPTSCYKNLESLPLTGKHFEF